MSWYVSNLEFLPRDKNISAQCWQSLGAPVLAFDRRHSQDASVIWIMLNPSDFFIKDRKDLH